jgi:nitrous oxide reductase accessory protein NosL
MKKKALCCGLVVFGLITAGVLWALENDIREIPACKYCGMNRETFAHSRMLIEYSDGAKEGLCSLHCAAIDLALNLDKSPRMIYVGDYGKKTLIDAEKALWIIGGGKPGVMTKTPSGPLPIRWKRKSLHRKMAAAWPGLTRPWKLPTKIWLPTPK